MSLFSLRESSLTKSTRSRSQRQIRPVEAGAVNHRGLSVSVAGMLRMCGEVHKVSSGCTGPIINAALTESRSDHDGFSAGCQKCGAIFGRIPVSKPSPTSLALGVVMGGGSLEQVVNIFALSDWQTPSARTLMRNFEDIAVAVDEVFETEMLAHQQAIKEEEGRGTIRVSKEKHFFAENMRRFADIIVGNISNGGLGVKVPSTTL